MLNDGAVERATTRRMFHTLDGLRGVAAVAVVVFHFDTYLSPIAAPSAYLAVDLFFVISGFVLGHAYHRALAGPLRPAQFLRLRLVRLYPLYAVGALVGLLVPLIGLVLGMSHQWSWSTLFIAAAPNLLMLPAPPILTRLALYPFNIPAWSLLFELLVNAAWVTLGRVSARVRSAAIPLAGLGVAAGAATLGSLDGGWLWSQWWLGVVRVCFSFGIGVELFRRYDSGGLPRLRVPPVLLLIAAAVLLAASPPGALRPAYDVACVLVVFPVLVWLCAVNDPRRAMSAFAWLGLISYPLYVVHVPARYLVDRAVARVLGDDPVRHAPAIGLAMIVALIGLAAMLATWYDPLARRVLARLTGTRTGVAAFKVSASTP